MSTVKITSLIKQFTNNVPRKISVELVTTKPITLEEVVEFTPVFCSVTWLDNNLTDLNNHPTITLARQLVAKQQNVLLHLPGKIFDASGMKNVLEVIKGIGVRNILALQGEYALWKDTSKNDFPYAKDLASFIKEHYGDYFCIGVTGYPAGHPRVETIEIDTQYLKQKVVAGADFIITQAIFDTESLNSFVERCNSNGINLPIIPGIFIITSHSSLMKMVRLCKLTLPVQTMDFVEANKDNVEVIRSYGVSRAKQILSSLFKDSGVPCVHIFTLNNLKLTKEVLMELK